jgi:hypothetical protein
MNTKRGSIAFVFILALALAATAGAYVLKSWRWPAARATFDTSQLPSSAWRSLARDAADEWEDTGEFDWTHLSSSQNKLSMKPLDGSNGTLATTTHDKYGNFLYKIAIFFDSGESWHTSSGTPPSSKYDALSVATHEFGHAVGLDHPQSSKCASSVPKSERPTMCQHGTPSDARKNDTYRRSLADDDEDGIEDQYNNTSSSGLVVDKTLGHSVCVDFDTAYITREDRARSAESVIHGTVTAVSDTYWNADDGKYWDDPKVSAATLPYHVVTLAPVGLIHDENEGRVASTSISFVVMQMSPIDSAGCGDSSTGPYAVGDEVVVFLENRQMAWRTGGMKQLLQPVNDPDSATIRKSSDGLFYELGFAEEAPEGSTVSEIQRAVHNLRDSE